MVQSNPQLTELLIGAVLFSSIIARVSSLKTTDLESLFDVGDFRLDLTLKSDVRFLLLIGA